MSPEKFGNWVTILPGEKFVDIHGTVYEGPMRVRVDIGEDNDGKPIATVQGKGTKIYSNDPLIIKLFEDE